MGRTGLASTTESYASRPDLPDFNVGASPMRSFRRVADDLGCGVDYLTCESGLLGHLRNNERTIRALVDCGIEAPERLLAMAEADWRGIPGVGKASMRQIRAYRDRFAPRQPLDRQ